MEHCWLEMQELLNSNIHRVPFILNRSAFEWLNGKKANTSVSSLVAGPRSLVVTFQQLQTRFCTHHYGADLFIGNT
jgi:hypothetical protein